jgi:hypothetical protein
LGAGGAIYAAGTLTVQDSMFDGNGAVDGNGNKSEDPSVLLRIHEP